MIERQCRPVFSNECVQAAIFTPGALGSLPPLALWWALRPPPDLRSLCTPGVPRFLLSLGDRPQEILGFPSDQFDKEFDLVITASDANSRDDVLKAYDALVKKGISRTVFLVVYISDTLAKNDRHPNSLNALRLLSALWDHTKTSSTFFKTYIVGGSLSTAATALSLAVHCPFPVAESFLHRKTPSTSPQLEDHWEDVSDILDRQNEEVEDEAYKAIWDSYFMHQNASWEAITHVTAPRTEVRLAVTKFCCTPVPKVSVTREEQDVGAGVSTACREFAYELARRSFFVVWLRKPPALTEAERLWQTWKRLAADRRVIVASDDHLALAPLISCQPVRSTVVAPFLPASGQQIQISSLLGNEEIAHFTLRLARAWPQHQDVLNQYCNHAVRSQPGSSNRHLVVPLLTGVQGAVPPADRLAQHVWDEAPSEHQLILVALSLLSRFGGYTVPRRQLDATLFQKFIEDCGSFPPFSAGLRAVVVEARGGFSHIIHPYIAEALLMQPNKTLHFPVMHGHFKTLLEVLAPSVSPTTIEKVFEVLNGLLLERTQWPYSLFVSHLLREGTNNMQLDMMISEATTTLRARCSPDPSARFQFHALVLQSRLHRREWHRVTDALSLAQKACEDARATYSLRNYELLAMDNYASCLFALNRYQDGHRALDSAFALSPTEHTIKHAKKELANHPDLLAIWGSRTAPQTPGSAPYPTQTA